MLNKISTMFMTSLVVVFLTACAKEPPKCSDADTFSLVRKIILDQIGGSEGLSEKEIQENMKIELPRASAFDEKIKKYSCEAKLIIGGTIQLPITYESQLDDNNQHIVAVGGISMGDLIAVKSALIEGIKKSRGTKETTPPPPKQTEVQPVTTVPSIAGTWKGSLEGDGEMEITPTTTGFNVDLGVSSPSGCGGSFKGSGALSDNTITLSNKDDDQVCTITIKFSGDTANIDENNCTYYHGAACSFDGTLKKIN